MHNIPSLSLPHDSSAGRPHSLPHDSSAGRLQTRQKQARRAGRRAASTAHPSAHTRAAGKPARTEVAIDRAPYTQQRRAAPGAAALPQRPAPRPTPGRAPPPRAQPAARLRPRPALAPAGCAARSPAPRAAAASAPQRAEEEGKGRRRPARRPAAAGARRCPAPPTRPAAPPTRRSLCAPAPAQWRRASAAAVKVQRTATPPTRCSMGLLVGALTGLVLRPRHTRRPERILRQSCACAAPRRRARTLGRQLAQLGGGGLQRHERDRIRQQPPAVRQQLGRAAQLARARVGALRAPRHPARHLHEHLNVAVWDNGGNGGRAARRPRPPRAPPPVAPPAPAAQAWIGWSRVHACWTEGGRQPRKARASGSVAVSRPSSPAPRAAAAPSTPSAQSAPRAGGGSGAPPAASTAWRAARRSRARLGRGHTMMVQHTVGLARRAFAGTPAASDTCPELSQAAARLRPPGWLLYAGGRGSPARSAPSPAAARRQPAAACPAGTQPRQAGAAQARPGARPPAPAARPRRPRAPAPPPPPRLGTRAARRRLPRRTPCGARGRLSMTAYTMPGASTRPLVRFGREPPADGATIGAGAHAPPCSRQQGCLHMASQLRVLRVLARQALRQRAWRPALLSARRGQRASGERRRLVTPERVYTLFYMEDAPVVQSEQRGQPLPVLQQPDTQPQPLALHVVPLICPASLRRPRGPGRGGRPRRQPRRGGPRTRLPLGLRQAVLDKCGLRRRVGRQAPQARAHGPPPVGHRGQELGRRGRARRRARPPRPAPPRSLATAASRAVSPPRIALCTRRARLHKPD